MYSKWLTFVSVAVLCLAVTVGSADAQTYVHVDDDAFLSAGQPAQVSDGTIITEIIHAGLVAPGGIATDANGNVYVAGAFSNNAFKIEPDGSVTEIIDLTGDGLGNLLSGSTLFAPDPVGIAADSSGNVYVTGSGSDNAFMVTPGGTISKIIDASGDGSGNGLDRPCGIAVHAGDVYVTGRDSDNAFRVVPPYGAANAVPVIDATGDGIGNTCDDPVGVAVDSVGNVYVACSLTNNAFRITPPYGAANAQQIITASGDNAGNTLSGAFGIAVDNADNVYVSGVGSNNVFRITSGGAITEIVDETGNGAGQALAAPSGLAVDNNQNVYVVSYGSNSAFRVTPPYGAANAEQIIHITGDGGSNFFSFPLAIAADIAGNAYVAGFGSHNAFKITAANVVTKVIDATGDGTGSLFDAPVDIAIDDAGSAYVAAMLSSNAFRITQAGVIDEIINTTGEGGLNYLAFATGIAANAAGNAYVTGLSTSNAFRITPPYGVANAVQIIDVSGDGAGNVLQQPADIAADDAGNAFVTGELSHNAFKIMPDGTVELVVDATGDGAGNGLAGPGGIAVDAGSNVYVAGLGSDNAFKITPPYGASNTEQIIDVNGDGAGNGLDSPSGIAVDSDGNVYVAGLESDNAFKIAPDGAITEIIDSTGDGNGIPCDGPIGVAVDCAGNAYVACSLSDNAFKITPAGVITVIIDATGDGSGNVCYRPSAIAVNCAGNVNIACMVSQNAFRLAADCNSNGIPDGCDLDCGTGGGSCDVGGCGLSEDADGDGIPDECQSVPNVLFVDDDAPAGGNGANWSTAFRCLQDALIGVGSGMEIRVAQGMYTPDQDEAGSVTPGDRQATFQLVNSVSLLGGFRGCPAGDCSGDPDERDLNAYPTVLSGDLAGDDVADRRGFLVCVSEDGEPHDSGCDAFDLDGDGDVDAEDGGIDENSYHVATGSGTDETAVVSGFTVTAGNAYAPWGTATALGGGMYNNAGSPTVTECSFRGNRARSGGGMYNNAGSPTLRNCIFGENLALNGGGLTCDRDSKLTMTNCIVSENLANTGGGLSCPVDGDLTMNSCIFRRNLARSSGGGINSGNSSLTINNCVFNGNSSGGLGGGISNFQPREMWEVTNCTFYKNSSKGQGGGIYAAFGGVSVTNSIFWGNWDASGISESSQIFKSIGFYLPVHFSCIQGPGSLSGFGGNIGDAPRFVDADGPDNIPATEDDDLRLRSGSPCIDAASNLVVPDDVHDLDDDGDGAERIPVDLFGYARFVDDPSTPDTGVPDPPLYTSVVDMGAFEYQVDCNDNGVLDATDITGGVSLDCNGNGIPDECEIDASSTAPGGPFYCLALCKPDCNNNGIPDSCDLLDCTISDPACDDCNLNGIPDGCDIDSGSSIDTAKPFGVPDECTAFDAGGNDNKWSTATNWDSNTVPDGIMDAATISGNSVDLDISVAIASLRLLGGATLAVTGMTDGDLSTQGGILVAGDTNGGIQSRFLVGNDRTINVGSAGIGRLELSSGGVYQAASGAAPSASLTAPEVLITSNACDDFSGGFMELTGTMSVDVSGDFILKGNLGCTGFPSGGAGTGTVAGGFTPPIKKTGSASIISIGGDLSLYGNAAWINNSSVGVSLAGDFYNQGIAPSQFDWTEGRIVLEGSEGPAQFFEVAGLDFGESLEGFATNHATLLDNGQHTNFSINIVEVASGASVRFVNHAANTAGSGQCQEALYVENLTLESGATVAVDNCRVYYMWLTDNGATIELPTGCGGLVQLPYDDGEWNLRDWNGFVYCVAGPNGAIHAPLCDLLDFDINSKIDMRDVAEFQNRLILQD